jgi:hypothetical protein
MTARLPLKTGLPLAVLLALGSFLAVRAADPTPEQIEHFEKKVRPVLAQYCYKCHSAQARRPKGGLRLDSRAGLLKGGDNGPAILPGHPDRSRLLTALRYTDPELQMPPKGKLPDSVLADLTAWVQMGAPWPNEAGPQTAAGTYAFDLAKRKREHWCWQPLHPTPPPPVRDGAWPLDPVDYFILAQLEGKGLAPASAADRRTLLRRVSFDLVGLPPTPEEEEAFLHDTSLDAFARVVDRLLASPHFGERWGRHWLDLVRYAETRGHEYDYTLPNAYQYRDYVLRAVNADVPYDRFVTEHIAGDLISNPRRNPAEGFNESILGTGFWFLGEQLHSPVDTCQDRADRVDNMLDVMTKAFLGLTVTCTRCHDHKFDAISTRDYYSLAGFLESSNYRLARFDALDHNRQVAQGLAELRQRSRRALGRELAEALRPGLARTAEYLTAAREILTGPGGEVRLTEVAQGRGLDRNLLVRWITYLTTSARDPADPLRGWARVATDSAAGNPGHFSEALQPLAEGLRKCQNEATTALKGAEVVVDYSRTESANWLQDGFAFGSGPVCNGELCLGGTPGQPQVTVWDRTAAVYDRTWDRLRRTPGAEIEPGAVGDLIGSGRILHTPTFRVTAGPVFYLVKGKGRAYAAVDGHVMIAGPLHAELLQPLDAGPDFRWVRHDLSRYKGSLAHVEFTPGPGSDFAVALVVQAANSPPLPGRPCPPLMHLLDRADSLAALAAGYQRLLTEAADGLAADRVGDYARLAAWLLDHGDLFTAEPGTVRKRLASAGMPFLVEHARLASEIHCESRLAPALLDGNGVDQHVFIRGAAHAPGELAPRRFLEALVGPAPLAPPRASGRLELARQMTDPAIDPLLPRVLVNRVWHHLFGRGLVGPVDNFGVLGEPPTHPELLDFLADRFVRDGWSVKRLIRSLVLSRTYQMSSRPDPTADRADPEDLLLHRMRVRRLEGEAIRDAMLTISGRLDRRVYGPPVPVYLTAFQEGRGKPASGPLDGAGRRSVYLSVHRNFLPAFLLAFDTPAPFSTVGRRTVSNVPAQALILMNDPFVHQQADVWAHRVLSRPGTARERVTGMYLRAFARPPDKGELSACLEFLEGRADAPAAWAALAHVLFNAKEMIFLP